MRERIPVLRFAKDNNLINIAGRKLNDIHYHVGVILLVIFYFSSSSWAANVESVRLWRAPDHTRLVFDLSGPADHKLFTLKSPSRLVIDLPNSDFNASLEGVDFANTPVDRLRHGRRGQDGLRVVLDLTAKVKPRSFILAKHGGKRDRLVIDLYDSSKETVKTVEAIAKVSHEKRDIILAIDAGHGGEDPGALGPKRIREKDVVYKVSLELKKLVDKAPGYRAVMVRTGDYYIPLRKRRDKARKIRADLFISIHADAFHNSKAKGASVFALSRRGATSETARFLASKENEADLIGGVGGVSLEDKDNVLAGVLVDLSMTATLANSLNVGEHVLKNIGKVTRLHKKHVEQAGFAVLKSPDVPSILVETGFISNPEEARKLNTHSHRRKLARAIFKGVTTYFNDSPPEGTLIAWKSSGSGGIKYVIGKGDTLSSIAARYKVSVAALLKANGLQNTNIRIGQTLTIPAG